MPKKQHIYDVTFRIWNGWQYNDPNYYEERTETFLADSRQQAFDAARVHAADPGCWNERVTVRKKDVVRRDAMPPAGKPDFSAREILGLEEETEPKSFRVCMVFGEDAVNAFGEASPKRRETVRKAANLVENAGGDLVIRSFSTEAERKAYLDGIYDGNGWQAYHQVSADELDFRNVPDRHND